MPEGVSARAPRIPLPPVFSNQTKGWRRWRHQMEAYCNATGMKQAMMMSEHASSDQHFKLYATLTALLPEELLHVIRRHLNDNATSGGQAWAALRTRFEGGHLGRISDMYAVLQSGQQRTETAEAYYHRLDNAFLDLVPEAEEHEDVEAPSHNQVVTQFLAGLRPEYEPIIGILQVTAEHEGRVITWEGDCLKLAQNYSAGAVAQANEREHDLDSHNMDEIISLSGLSDCFGMSDDEAGSASGSMGGSARVVTKSDSAYLLDAVALASAVVDARGACVLGLNDDLGSYPDVWVKDSGAYPHLVADHDSFVEYEQLAPPVEVGGICCLAVGRGTV
eukprot:jgi/Tetstr1/443560/TSEL_031561.t1